MKKQRSYDTTTATLFALVVIRVAILTVLISGLSLGCSVAAAQSQPVCFALVEKVTFTTTRDNPNFVPIQNAGEIYMMNPDGSDPERVTDNLVQDTFSQFSPDGKKFIFDSNRLRLETDPINVVDLFVMATDGSEQTHVTRGNSAQWAPDSKNIVYHRSASGTGLPIRLDPGAPDTDSDIFRVNVDDCCGMGVNPINLTNSPTLIEDDPHWSPDGTKIVYTAHDVNDNPPGPFFNYPTTEIFVINADGSGSPVQLTFNNEEERAATWSPDGTKIVFMCRYGGGTDFEICTINPDGSGLVQLTNNTVQELSIKWSVDGTKFFFNRPVSGGGQELFSINTDGTGETQLTNTPGTNLFPAPGLLRVHTDCRHSSALPAQAPLATAGLYDLLFLDANTRLEVTSKPFGSPVILHAHIEDSTNNPANRGSVVFQYCSLKGRPPNDIDRVDEAPLEECAADNANWALLAHVPVDEFGNAELVFCCPMITPTIGFRFTYQPQGSSIAKHTIDPENFNWVP